VTEEKPPSSLGAILARLGSFEEGIAHIRKAADIADEVAPDWRPYPDACLARAHIWLEETAEAEKLLAGPQPDLDTFGGISIAIGRIELAIARSQYAGALEELTEFDIENINRGDSFAASVLTLYARAYTGLGQLEKAEEALQRARVIIEALRTKRLLWDWLTAAIAAAEARGDETPVRMHQGELDELNAFFLAHLKQPDRRVAFMDVYGAGAAE
jgi:tetratricopeptide (TPR) repeat protein